MNLTEPHAGTDLGLLRTRAEPQADGSYRITGQKIFISAGDHDLAENIVHLVLARIPGAPAGVKGISLFIVPKFLPNPDGSLGDRNAVVRRQARGEDGHPRQRHLRDELRRRHRLAARPGERAACKAMFTMMNEARALRRHAGPRPGRRPPTRSPPPTPASGCRAAPSPAAPNPDGPGRPAHRPPRRPPRAARPEGLRRGRPRLRALGRDPDRRPRPRRRRRPPTAWSRSSPRW